MPSGYEERVLQLEPGDCFYLITDGITEAQDEKGEQFGMGRFLRALDRVRSLPLEQTGKQLMRQVESWSGNAGIKDDASVLACRVASMP